MLVSSVRTSALVSPGDTWAAGSEGNQAGRGTEERRAWWCKSRPAGRWMETRPGWAAIGRFQGWTAAEQRATPAPSSSALSDSAPPAEPLAGRTRWQRGSDRYPEHTKWRRWCPETQPAGKRRVTTAVSQCGHSHQRRKLCQKVKVKQFTVKLLKPLLLSSCCYFWNQSITLSHVAHLMKKIQYVTCSSPYHKYIWWEAWLLWHHQ